MFVTVHTCRDQTGLGTLAGIGTEGSTYRTLVMDKLRRKREQFYAERDRVESRNNLQEH